MTSPSSLSTALPVASSQRSGAGVPADVRVSVLIGDRPCVRCGFNLSGQPVLREGHYGMLIVRCPECATAASLQEYPLLGKWASRWAFVFAALWLLLILGLAVGSGAALYGFGAVAADIATEPFAMHIATVHQKYQQENADVHAGPPAPGGGVFTGIGNPAYVNQGISLWTMVEPAWWKLQNPSKLFADAGGWIDAVDWLGMAIMAPSLLLLFVIGVVWSVLLAHVRPSRLVLVLLPALAFALVFIAIDAVGSYGFGRVQWTYAFHLARPHVLLVVEFASAAILAGAMAVGLIVGRKVARLAIRALLPPRQRAAFAFIWTTDGMRPPASVPLTVRR